MHARPSTQAQAHARATHAWARKCTQTRMHAKHASTRPLKRAHTLCARARTQDPRMQVHSSTTARAYTRTRECAHKRIDAYTREQASTRTCAYTCTHANANAREHIYTTRESTRTKAQAHAHTRARTRLHTRIKIYARTCTRAGTNALINIRMHARNALASKHTRKRIRMLARAFTCTKAQGSTRT